MKVVSTVKLQAGCSTWECSESSVIPDSFRVLHRTEVTGIDRADVNVHREEPLSRSMKMKIVLFGRENRSSQGL